MTPAQILFSYVRAAHETALQGATTLMQAVSSHDGNYPNFTVGDLESAAEKLEKSARQLREQIAVYQAATGLPISDPNEAQSRS
jgi:thiamine pyrophosphokinase